MGLSHDVKHTKDKSASKCAAMTADFNLESKANGKTPLQRGPSSIRHESLGTPYNCI